MGFSERQARALARNVPTRAIRSRLSAGRELSYIEGWYALSEANRIFGFDGWDRETVETKCLVARETRGTYSAVYMARVRITVRTGAAVITRDGHGTGEAYGLSAGEVHDRALKAAETDATKRALATFGKAFGLALYAGGRQKPISRDQRELRTVVTQTEHPRIPPQIPPGETSSTSVLSSASNRCPLASAAAVIDPTMTSRSVGDSWSTDAGISVDLVPAAIDGALSSEQEATVQKQKGIPLDAGHEHDAATYKAGVVLRPHIEKSVLAYPEPYRARDKDHLRYVASQPCLLCNATPSDAHHLRCAQPRAMARKVGDDYTVPLCRAHHRELHKGGNESAWWHDMGIEPLEIAKRLWEESAAERSGPEERPASAHGP